MEKKQNKVEYENGEGKGEGEDRAEVQPQKQEQQQRRQQQVNKKKRKDVFPFGNYRNYYGYRIGEGLDEDPRLKVFKKEWFQGKDCLDIGCNSGIITIQIAQKFHCRSIVGIDIDSNRVEDAYWHLRKSVRMERDKRKRKIVKMEQDVRKLAKSLKLEVAEKADGSEHNATAINEEKKDTSRDHSPPADRDLFGIVSFRQENFVHSPQPSEKHYDAILCLSVTKWIHMNWGDDGLITLFTRIWRLLRPGGVLVLEPQPWQSYENNRRVSETTATNFRNIKFRPEQFQEILLDKIGFRTVEDISCEGLSGSKSGFNRPIFLFCK